MQLRRASRRITIRISGIVRGVRQSKRDGCSMMTTFKRVAPKHISQPCSLVSPVFFSCYSVCVSRLSRCFRRIDASMPPMCDRRTTCHVASTPCRRIHLRHAAGIPSNLALSRVVGPAHYVRVMVASGPQSQPVSLSTSKNSPYRPPSPRCLLRSS